MATQRYSVTPHPIETILFEEFLEQRQNLMAVKIKDYFDKL